MKPAAIGWGSVVLLAALAVLASGQSESNCEVSDLDEFEFMHSPSYGFLIYWTHRTTEISFMVEVENEQWTAIGFSSDGDMIGSDAVIFLPEEDEVSEYILGAKSISSITEAETSDLTSTESSQEGGDTIFSFTRNTTPDDPDSKFTIPSTAGTPVYVIWAEGADNDFAYHGEDSRGSFSVDLFCPTLSDDSDDVLPTSSMEETPAPSVTTTMAGTPAPTVAPTMEATAVETPAASTIAPEAATPAPSATIRPTPAPTAAPGASSFTLPPGGVTPAETITPAPSLTEAPGSSSFTLPPGGVTPAETITPAPSPTAPPGASSFTLPPGGITPADTITPASASTAPAASSFTLPPGGITPAETTPPDGPSVPPAVATTAPAAASFTLPPGGIYEGGSVTPAPTAGSRGVGDLDMTPVPVAGSGDATSGAAQGANGGGATGVATAAGLTGIFLGLLWGVGL
ncbi:unnamed protein product [Scytosiphon promiscuus]